MNFVYVRDRSDDRSVWTSVLNDDEYRIDNLKPDDIVLDIGMHTGSFCARAYVAGSRIIYGFEVDTENFRLAQANVGTLAQVHNAAVVRSDDRRGDPVYYTGHIPMSHELNTGVGTIFGESGTPAPTVSLDEILAQLPSIRLMKLDTEGSEYPILYTSTYLFKVQEMVGEWHLNHTDIGARWGIGEVSLEELKARLTQDDFEVRFYAREEDMPNPVVGYFRALNVKSKYWNPNDPWHIGDGRAEIIPQYEPPCASES